MQRTHRLLTAAALTAGLVVAGAGVAAAQPDPTSPQPGVSAERKERPRAARRAAHRIGRSVHGDAVVRNQDGQWITVTWDRGEVTAVSATSITLERPDGVSVTLTINADTKFHGAKAGEVKTGQPALVVSQQGTATQIAQRKA